MDVDKLLKQIEMEAESNAVGHDAYNKTVDAKFFNPSALDNLVVDGDDFKEYPEDTKDDSHSTFDEANFNLTYQDEE